MKRKIKAILYATLLLAVGMLSACGGSDIKERKAMGIDEINMCVAEKDKAAYSPDNWEILCNAAEAGKAEIGKAKNASQIEQIVDSAKQAIDRVLRERDMQEFFEIAIATDANSSETSKDIKIKISLTNKSEKDLKISYDFLWTPDFPTASKYPALTEAPEEYSKRVFAQGETITEVEDISNYFDPGSHEIRYRVCFRLGWDEIESKVNLWSNTITILIPEV